jgi:hypothetical protein
VLTFNDACAAKISCSLTIQETRNDSCYRPLDGAVACGACSGMRRQVRTSKKPTRSLNRSEPEEQAKRNMRPADLALSRKRDVLKRDDSSLEKLWAEVRALREQVRKAEKSKHLH